MRVASGSDEVLLSESVRVREILTRIFGNSGSNGS